MDYILYNALWTDKIHCFIANTHESNCIDNQICAIQVHIATYKRIHIAISFLTEFIVYHILKSVSYGLANLIISCSCFQHQRSGIHLYGYMASLYKTACLPIIININH